MFNTALYIFLVSILVFIEVLIFYAICHILCSKDTESDRSEEFKNGGLK